MASTNFDDEIPTGVIDPLVLRSRQRVGQVLREKWRLDVLLGVGGMASVYAATHRNGSRVAIKMLHQELSIHPQVRSRFMREGYVANSVGHEGAVHVIDDDTAEDGSLFLVTELLDGETLEDRRLRFGGQLSEDEVLWLVDQLLDVLIAAHGRGIVHRDIKPENVFLTRAGTVKVLDFGIARLREVSSASTATRSGASMGTPAYMAPEQARGLWDEVDVRSDIWSVGATMFHLLTGKPVHDGRTANEVLLEAMTKPAPPIAEVATNVAPAVSHLVDKALAFERENRWQDAGRMQEVLRRAYVDRNGAQITTAPKLTVPPNVPNRTLATADGALLPSLPTTGQPVADARALTTAGHRRRLRPATLAAIVFVGAAIGVTIAAVAIAVVTAKGGASHAMSAAAIATSAPAAASSPSPPPEVAATDLPSAAANSAPTPARPSPSPRPVSPPAPPAPRADCTPPYTVDSTGHKHWKVQCL
ncbi:MAG TPA: serine/threonine-protein kinase [Polyangiaceae bacterium]|nr:serine/threonine-protein kinase [Polyangiaceae bacterium]